MNKRDEITDGLYARMRSTGGQRARLYGLSKVHIKDTTLQLLLSRPGSFYGKLKKTQPKFFDKIQGANIETNTETARYMIENTKLESEECIISLEVKILYPNFPLKDANDIALRKLYSQNEPPDLSRSTMKRILYIVVTEVYFKFNDIWKVQKDALTIAAFLAVILANL